VNPEQAVTLVSQWPDDRTIPEQLSEAIEQAENPEQKAQLGMLVEALFAAAQTQEDLALIQEFFG